MRQKIGAVFDALLYERPLRDFGIGERVGQFVKFTNARDIGDRFDVEDERGEHVRIVGGALQHLPQPIPNRTANFLIWISQHAALRDLDYTLLREL
jgi:hypothetical protein